MSSLFWYFPNASSSSSSSSTPNVFLEKKNNLEDINQSIDNWKIPKPPTSQINNESKWTFSYEYTIKTEEQTIALHSEYE